jgi:predicted RNase H-like nuclease (RuvC/YqgF family)
MAPRSSTTAVATSGPHGPVPFKVESSLMDHLAQLEERVESLIQQIEMTKRNNAELRDENARLRRELDELAGSRQHSQGLQAEVDRLQHELDAMSGREGLIRDRLQGMLEKIDSIEKDIHPAAGPMD